MTWQDIVLMIGNFCFAIALIPTIRSKHKPPIATSAMTSIILIIFCIVYLSLGLNLGFIATALTAVCWLVILIQKKEKKNETTKKSIQEKTGTNQNTPH